MPEGDTLHRTAAALGPALLGKPLVQVTTRQHGCIAAMQGAVTEGVEAVGKHLLVTVAGGAFVRVHLGMKGSFRRYAPTALREADRQRAPLLLQTTDEAFVCWGPSQVAFGHNTTHKRAQLASVGTDLMTDLDGPALLQTLRAPEHHQRAVAELLLDQRPASGIGNVYKSELLFLCRVHPWQTAAALSDERLLGLYQLAQQLLQHNLHTTQRITTRLPGVCPSATRPPSRLWVYGRANKPCWVCGTSVALGRQGDLARSTYWCRTCQAYPGH